MPMHQRDKRKKPPDSSPIPSCLLWKKVATVSHDAANIVSPIARSNYVNKREHSRRAKEVKEEYPTKQPKTVLVNEYIKRVPLSVVAACMVMFGHVKDNISRLNESKCLLVKLSNNFFLMTNAEADLWGCYLLWDTVKYKWIRSGKATGDSGIKRCNKEHKRRAESDENDDNTELYNLYPSILSIH